MRRYDVICLFPDMILRPLLYGIVGRALTEGVAEVHAYDLKNYGIGKKRQVDDRPYGGGPGMVLMCAPLFAAVEDVRRYNSGPVVLMSAQGVKLTQNLVKELAGRQALVIVCGRYEGVDQRFIEKMVDMEISIGDYILSGGEPAAVVLLDSIIRTLPGVVGNAQSLEYDSFANQPLLGYPQYTRPANFRGMRVPDVLLSGDHKAIKKWRELKAIELTRKRRPDLVK